METENVKLLKDSVSGYGSEDFSKVALNKDLFDMMVQPACFNQCSRKDIDIVFTNEIGCMYKCMIAYKQGFNYLATRE